MSQWTIVVPLLNKKVTTGSTCYLGDKVSLQTINEETYYILNYRAEITAKSKCLYVGIDETESSILESDQCDVHTRAQARKAQTLLNLLSDGKPALLAPAAVICKKRKAKVMEIVDLWAIPDIEQQRKQSYGFISTIERSSIRALYKIIDQACNDEERVAVTLDRFNSSLTRIDFADKVIDTTISLESLILSRDELRFKFSLYLSFILAEAPEKREESFKLLRNLYDARSRLVHGDHKSKEIGKVSDNWETIHSFLKGAITYYLSYLSYDREEKWDEHLRRLVFGLDKRIVDEN